MAKAKKNTKKPVQDRSVWAMVLHVALSIIFLAILALFLAWFIQFRFLDNDINATWDFVTNKFKLFLYGALILFLVLTLLAALVGRPFIVGGFSFAILLIMSYANTQKILLRDEPLLPTDLLLAGNTGDLVGFVDKESLLRIILAAILAIVLGFVLNFLAHKIWPFDKNIPWWRRHSIIQRILLIMILGLMVIVSARPIYDSENPNHESLTDQLCLNVILWSQQENYNINGPLIGFLTNLNKHGVGSPAHYNEETIKQIAQKYNEEKTKDDKRKDLVDIADNVIVVLSESSYDPALVDEYVPHTGGEIMPNLHKIMAKYPSGRMYSTAYGGGTANVEAEVFSGLTNYWTQTTLYDDIFSKKELVPSIATYTKKSGYDKVIAIHSYTERWYKRKESLASQGFDRFITYEEMRWNEIHVGAGWISDRSIYNETLDHIRNNNLKEMVGVITMQNHGGYYTDLYEKLNFQIINKGSDERLPIEAYYQTLHDSDQYLGEFIQALDKINEKTVVLWFGDHSGGVYSDLREHGKEMVDLTQQTPYFIYANFDLDKEFKNLPMTTPNCLVNTMYNVLGSKKPTLGYLLDNVCETNPILTDVFLQGNDPQYDDALKDYQLVNYDLMFGEQYWLKYADY